MNKRLLLISNSTSYGGGYLDHCEAEIRDFLGAVRSVWFVPFALRDRQAYGEKAKARLAAMGYTTTPILESRDMQPPVAAGAIFVGGGNTFRLLRDLWSSELLTVIAACVQAGIPYIGSSAGSIVAGPTIKTTKDMPVVQPPSFVSLNLVPFQISPHYLDPDPASTHMGETQEERIFQFLEENDAPVVGLRERALLRVENGSVLLKGSAGARIFRRGHAPVEARPGDTLDYLMARDAA